MGNEISTQTEQARPLMESRQRASRTQTEQARPLMESRQRSPRTQTDSSGNKTTTEFHTGLFENKLENHVLTRDEKKATINLLHNCDDFLKDVRKNTRNVSKQIKELATNLETRQSVEEKLTDEVSDCDRECKTKDELMKCYRQSLNQYNLLVDNSNSNSNSNGDVTG